MDYRRFQEYNINDLETPCYVVDEFILEANLKVLKNIARASGCKILLALKAFSMYHTFGLINEYLDGICASSLNEARLGFEEFSKEVHTFSPAYNTKEFDEIMQYSDYVIFNSFSQWEKYKDLALAEKIKCGLRVNPEYSEIKVSLYDPCSKNSRLGVSIEQLSKQDMEGISGLHFHAMCEQNADTLLRVLSVFENKFSDYIQKMEWVNFGGGHHITRDDYDVDLLCKLIVDFKKKYGVEIYLEPGEAVALNAGVLVASVMDIVNNGIDIAILDVSAETHMPDVLAMPYVPEVLNASSDGEGFSYRLAGPSCLAGDIIGDYVFKKPLNIGDKIVFLDMAHYTMVKNTTFNGVNLPSIAISKKSGAIEIVKKFGYEDFKSRLS